MATIKDVAARAGVSISTVSNALRGTKPVSPELRERIDAAVLELDYHVHPVASSLKSKQTNSVGLLVPNINRIFFPQVFRGIQDTLAPRGLSVTVCDTDDSIDKERQFVELLRKNWADGIIVGSVAPESDREYFDRLAGMSGGGSKRIPVISLERRMGDGIDAVLVDNRAGGVMAAAHLAECGCRNVAHVSGPKYSCMAKDRLAGFRAEATRRGCVPGGSPLPVATGDFSPAGGYRAMRALLQTHPEIDGLYAANDQMAIGAIQAARETGRNVPGDLKVIGYDNTFVASLVSPSLSTIHVPKYRMGQSVAELLLERIADPDGPRRRIELPIELVVRESTVPSAMGRWELEGW